MYQLQDTPSELGIVRLSPLRCSILDRPDRVFRGPFSRHSVNQPDPTDDNYTPYGRTETSLSRSTTAQSGHILQALRM